MMRSRSVLRPIVNGVRETGRVRSSPSSMKISTGSAPVELDGLEESTRVGAGILQYHRPLMAVSPYRSGPIRLRFGRFTSEWQVRIANQGRVPREPFDALCA